MTEISTDPRQAQGEISKDEQMRRNEEMENYRMALAYIARQSTDEQSRELAQTALDTGQPQSPTVDLDADLKEHRFYRDALIEECANVAEGSAPIAAGNFMKARRDQCAKIATKIRALSHTRPDRNANPSAPGALAPAQSQPE